MGSFFIFICLFSSCSCMKTKGDKDYEHEQNNEGNASFF